MGAPGGTASGTATTTTTSAGNNSNTAFDLNDFPSLGGTVVMQGAANTDGSTKNNNYSMQVDQIHNNNNNNSNNKCHNNKSNNNSSSSYSNKTICTDWPCKEDRMEGTSIWQRRTFQHYRVLLHQVITVQMYQ